jgi:hypothetical protein
MSDEPKKYSPALMIWVALMLLAYSLSLGPAMRYARRSSDRRTKLRAVDSVYAPLKWLSVNSESARYVIDGYIGLWLP